MGRGKGARVPELVEEWFKHQVLEEGEPRCDGYPRPPIGPQLPVALDGAVRVEGVDRAHLKKQKKVERSQVRNSRGRKFEIREVAGSRLTLRFVIATRCRSQWRVPRGKQMG